VDVLARKDRAGLTMAEGIDLIQEILPKLTRVQAQRSFLRTIQPKNKHFLNQNLVVAQGTTTKRTGITAEQPFRWVKTYEKSLVFLREKNTGTCCLTKKSFGEVIHRTSFRLWRR
jgi:hypothetical protein